MQINYSKLRVTWKNNLNNIYKENTIIGVGQEAVINISSESISNIYVNFEVDGVVYTDLVQIEKNIIHVPFKTDVLKKGTHKLEIVAYLKNGDVVPSPTFSYYVEDAIENPNDITAETNYPILIQLLEEVEEWNEDVKRKEVERQENENTRISNENTRISNENTRETNETNRRQYEDTRRIEEDERLTLEEQRQNAELIRVANENERLRREVRRQDNEQNRETRFNEMEAEIEKFKIDTNAAMTAHKNEVSEELESVNTQLPQIEKGICVNSDNSAIVINNMQILAINDNKPLIIKSGTYIIDETVNLTDNVCFEKNVIFMINKNIDGVTVQYNGRPLDFNGLKIIVNVDDYTCTALTIKGYNFTNDADLCLNKITYTEIKNVTVHNAKTIYPYTNASGTGICIKIENKQIFMWTKFDLYASQFENGFLFLSTAIKDGVSFVSSCDFNLISWRNSNSIVVNDINNVGWGDLRIKLKNQPAQNQIKVIKNENGSFGSSLVDVALWDMQYVDEEYTDKLIDIDVGRGNTYINSFDNGSRPIHKYINYNNEETNALSYAATRLDTISSRGNMIILNPWDYMYVFGEGILSTDSFDVARDKLLSNVNKLKHNGDIIIELSAVNGEYAATFRDKIAPFIPRVPNDSYGFGKIKITLPCHKRQFKSIFVEFTSTSTSSINVCSFVGTRFSSQNGSDSLWTILGDLHGTTEQRNNLSTDIRKPQGFKFYDTTLGKPVFAVWGTWVDSTGSRV